MKKVLRLSIAAGIFLTVLASGVAAMWMAPPLAADLELSLRQVLEAVSQPAAATGSRLHSQETLSPQATEPLRLAAQERLATSVAGTLAHWPTLEAAFAGTTSTPLPSAAASHTPAPSVSADATAQDTPTPTATASPSASLPPSATSTRQTSATPSPTSLPSRTPSPQPSPTSTPTAAPTTSPSPVSTSAATATRTPTPTPSATGQSASPTPTASGPAPTPTVDLGGCDYTNDSSFENQVLALLNQERDAVGLPPLAMQSQLRSAAREHSADMACNNFVSHTGSNGTTSYDRIVSYGYFPAWWGENIYKGWRTTPEQVVAWWMDSTPHRNNILHSYYVHIGIGHVQLGDSVAYTLNFGKR